MPGAPDNFAIGSLVWPGLSKLNEECGENVQVIGKIMAFPRLGEFDLHPDGTNLTRRLEEELGDLQAAIDYVTAANDDLDNGAIQKRRERKLDLFLKWHNEEQERQRGRKA
jgi:hypothetical protein